MVPKVSLITLNWNGLKDTLECLTSVFKIDYPNFDVVVVDNGSKDDSVIQIKGRFPQVTVLSNEKNLGFAEGNNVAIRYLLKTDSQYFMMLNNDTVVDPLMLKEFMFAAKAYPDAGIYGGKIYYFSRPDRIWFAGARWNAKAGSFLYIGADEIDDGDRYAGIEEVDHVNGCALLFSRKVVEVIGLLDEKFFAYFEETDWCFRAKKHGFRSIFVPRAKIWHKISKSTGGSRSPLFYYYMSWNGFLWVKKNFNGLERLNLYIRFFFGLFSPGMFSIASTDIIHPWFKRLYWDLLRLNESKVKIKFLGFWDFILGNFGECKRVF